MIIRSIGDSNAWQHSFISETARILAWDFIDGGISGARMPDILSSAKSNKIYSDVCILLGGTNEIPHAVWSGLANIRTYYPELIKVALETSRIVIPVLIHPWRSGHETSLVIAANGEIANAASSAGLRPFDLFSIMASTDGKADDPLDYVDEVHLSVVGKVKAALSLVKFIYSNFSETLCAPVDGSNRLDHTGLLCASKRDERLLARCKVCGHDAIEFCNVDFNYAVSDHERMPLGPSGSLIKYYKCIECHFIFSNRFDDWSPEEFATKIYNSDYLKVDPDYAGKRPVGMAQMTRDLLQGSDLKQRVLDFGGGIGILSAELRKFGYENAETWDPFTSKNTVSGTFKTITAYEVFEHNSDPEALFTQLSGMLDEGGLIFVSTHVVPPNIDSQRENWWYIGPRNGHISLYSLQSIKIMCARFGMRCWSDGVQFHVFARRKQSSEVQSRLTRLAERFQWLEHPVINQDDFYAYLQGAFPDEYSQLHYVRYLETLSRSSAYMHKNLRVIELGELSPLSSYISDIANVSCYKGDLRYQLDLPSGYFDLVLLLEVVEHVKDQDSSKGDIGSIAMFNGSGLATLFSEIFRILNDNGVVIVSTPNVCSLSSIARLVAGEHPFEYFFHVREHAPRDIIKVASDAGLNVESFSTFFSFMPRTGVDRDRLLETVAYLGGDPSDRGDTMFFALHKKRSALLS